MFTLVYCDSVPWEVSGFCTHILCTFEIAFLEIIMQLSHWTTGPFSCSNTNRSSKSLEFPFRLFSPICGWKGKTILTTAI